MNNKFGTTKLLLIAQEAVSSKALYQGAVVIRFGELSSGVVMVDSTDAKKLLLFQITFTEQSHRGDCVNFLASGEDKDLIRKVFVDRIVPEFGQRLPEFVDRSRTVNFAEQVWKSARLLPDLHESLDDIQYPLTTENDPNLGGSVSLVDSYDAATRITKIDKQNGGTLTSRCLDNSTHQILTGAHQALAGLLGEALTKGEPTDSDLTFLLHNMTLADRTNEFQREFAEIAQPALRAYSEILKSECEPGRTVFICDSIFSSRYCREQLVQCGVECRNVRFVQDPGLLGSLGALIKDEVDAS